MKELDDFTGNATLAEENETLRLIYNDLLSDQEELSNKVKACITELLAKQSDIDHRITLCEADLAELNEKNCLLDKKISSLQHWLEKEKPVKDKYNQLQLEYSNFLRDEEGNSDHRAMDQKGKSPKESKRGTAGSKLVRAFSRVGLGQ